MLTPESAVDLPNFLSYITRGLQIGAPRDIHIPAYLNIDLVFCISETVIFSGRGAFPALLTAERARDPRVHYGASLGPGRAPWHVVWAFKVARTGK